jgi:hypothetical protein
LTCVPTANPKPLTGDRGCSQTKGQFSNLCVYPQDHLTWRRWHQRTTVLFVTHSIDEAVSLADRVVVFSPQLARITATVPVELPHPRDQETPRFTALKHELRT